VNADNFELAGGTIRRPGHLMLRTSLIGRAGQMLTLDNQVAQILGVTLVGPTSVMNITGNANKTLRNREIRNQGDIFWGRPDDPANAIIVTANGPLRTPVAAFLRF